MIFKNATPPLTLASAIGPADTSITVNEDVSWVEPGMVLVIDPTTSAEEAVFVQAVDTTTKSLMVARGIDAYVAQPHSAGASIRHMVTALSLSMAGIGTLPLRFHYTDWWTPTYLPRGSMPNPGFADEAFGDGRLIAVAFPVRMLITGIAIHCKSAGSADGTTHFALYRSYLTYPDAKVIPKWRVWKATFTASSSGKHEFDLSASPILVSPGIYFWAMLHRGYTTKPAFRQWDQAIIPNVLSLISDPTTASALATSSFAYDFSQALTNTGDPMPADIETYLLNQSKSHALIVWLKTQLI